MLSLVYSLNFLYFIKNKERHQHYVKLLKNINFLKENCEDISMPENIKRELENIRKHNLKGAMVRSRAKWISEEKNLQNIFVT